MPKIQVNPRDKDALLKLRTDLHRGVESPSSSANVPKVRINPRQDPPLDDYVLRKYDARHLAASSSNLDRRGWSSQPFASGSSSDDHESRKAGNSGSPPSTSSTDRRAWSSAPFRSSSSLSDTTDDGDAADLERRSGDSLWIGQSRSLAASSCSPPPEPSSLCSHGCVNRDSGLDRRRTMEGRNEVGSNGARSGPQRYTENQTPAFDRRSPSSSQPQAREPMERANRVGVKQIPAFDARDPGPMQRANRGCGDGDYSQQEPRAPVDGDYGRQRPRGRMPAFDRKMGGRPVGELCGGNVAVEMEMVGGGVHDAAYALPITMSQLVALVGLVAACFALFLLRWWRYGKRRLGSTPASVWNTPLPFFAARTGNAVIGDGVLSMVEGREGKAFWDDREKERENMLNQPQPSELSTLVPTRTGDSMKGDGVGKRTSEEPVYANADPDFRKGCSATISRAFTPTPASVSNNVAHEQVNVDH